MSAMLPDAEVDDQGNELPLWPICSRRLIDGFQGEAVD